MTRVTLLAGGVGGARMAVGLAATGASECLSVIGNVADDQVFHGLWVSPDIDTLTYTLAGEIHPEQGWGLAGDRYETLRGLQRFGADTWMQLGDRDLATHIFRTQQRHAGVRPSVIATHIAQSLGISANIVLPTDDPLQTQVLTHSGWLAFQEYFVRERCEPEVLDIRFQGLERASATPEALHAISQTDVLVIAPSNPIVSIKPILSIPGLREAVEQTRALRLAVSPLIGGKPVKGPADRMLRAAGFVCDSTGVADSYAGLIDGLVIDRSDEADSALLQEKGLHVLVTDTLMRDDADKRRLASELLAFAEQTRPAGRSR